MISAATPLVSDSAAHELTSPSGSRLLPGLGSSCLFGLVESLAIRMLRDLPDRGSGEIEERLRGATQSEVNSALQLPPHELSQVRSAFSRTPSQVIRTWLDDLRQRTAAPRELPPATPQQCRILEESRNELKIDFLPLPLTSWEADAAIKGLLVLSELWRETGQTQLDLGALRAAVRHYIQKKAPHGARLPENTEPLISEATEPQLQIILTLQTEVGLDFTRLIEYLNGRQADALIKGMTVISEVQRLTGNRRFPPGDVRKAVRSYLRASPPSP